MKLKTIHELDFVTQRAIVGGAGFGECTCTGDCICKCTKDDPSASTKNDNKKWESDQTMGKTQANNL